MSSKGLEEQMAVFNNSAYTSYKYVKCNFTWIVDNFSFCPKDFCEYLQSPKFSVVANGEYKWCILLYPRGDLSGTTNYQIILDLKLIQAYREDPVLGKYKFSILKGEKTNVVQSEVSRFERHNRQILMHFTTLCQSVTLLPDDRLTILCEIWILTDNDGINSPDYASAMQVVSPVSGLSDDFGLMYENQEFSDVTIFADGKKFRAHKAILAARSPVFKAMFQHDMEEKKLNQINISDIQSETVQEMLRFIYTGKVFNIEKHAKKLLAAADKYALETLKEMCVTVLCGDTITTKNVTELLVLADLHNIKQLKAQVISFIHTHIKDVMKSPEWILMVKTARPALLIEILRVKT